MLSRVLDRAVVEHDQHDRAGDDRREQGEGSLAKNHQCGFRSTATVSYGFSSLVGYGMSRTVVTPTKP